MSIPRPGTEESRERKIALFWTLVQAHETSQPITQSEIVEHLMVDEFPSSGIVPLRKRAYDGLDNARRQKFERDKAAIRDLGFEILTTKNEFDVDAYSIDPSSVYVPAIDFADDELDVVVSAMRLLGLGASGVSRLFAGGSASGSGFELSPVMQPLTRAVATGRVVRFRYRKSHDAKREREIAPLDFLVWNGQIYVIGVESDAASVKGFRVSRIEGIPSVTAQRVTVTADARAAASAWVPKPDEPGPTRVRFTTSPEYARLLSATYRTEIHEAPSGLCEVHVEFDSPGDARRAILTFGDRVLRLRPREMRDEVLRWLRGVNRHKGRTPTPVFAAEETRSDVLGQSLALISAVYQSPAPLRASELARRFGIEVELVRSIMSRVMSLQYIRDPHRYLVHIEPGDDVDEPEDPAYARSYSYETSSTAGLAPLTWLDAMELLVALKEAAVQYPSGPLSRVLTKIEAVLQANVRVQDVELEFLSQVQDAIDAHQQLKISYWSATADRASDRWVEPRAMASRNGRWYFRAWCSTREAWLTFRVDRILYVHAVGPGEAHPTDSLSDWSTLSTEEGADVTIAFLPEARWLFESLPAVRFAALGDDLEAVRLRVSDERFLDQLMVQAGPTAWVIEPEGSAAGRELAKSMSDLL